MDQNILGAEYPKGFERINFIEANCDEVIEKGYMKKFTPEEIEDQKNQLAEVSININDIEEEKKEKNDEFKIKLKPLIEIKSELLTGIKQKAYFTREKCFKFIDLQTKMVAFRNGDGEIIEERAAMGDELQRNMFQDIRQKTGTNN